jgi:hypothetical protein
MEMVRRYQQKIFLSGNLNSRGEPGNPKTVFAGWELVLSDPTRNPA